MAARGRPKGAPAPVCLVPKQSLQQNKDAPGWGEQREELFVASNYTTNYQLNQWEAGDQVLRTEFNQDNQKIDTALAGLAAQNTELAAAVANKGNCQLYTTSYVGTGTYNSTSPCSLSFPGTPLVVLIGACSSQGTLLCALSGMPVTFAHSSGYSMNMLTWSGNTLTWYHHMSADGQLNSAGVTYQVIALLATGTE